MSLAKRLTPREAFALLAQWCRAKTKLSLKTTGSLSSFQGIVRVLEADERLMMDVSFTWLFEGDDNKEQSFGVSVFESPLWQEIPASETRPRSLIFRGDGFSFVVAEVPPSGNFEDFDLASLLVN